MHRRQQPQGTVERGCVDLRGSGRTVAAGAVTGRLGRGEVQDDEEPDECAQDELIENMMRDHGVAPSNMS